MFVSVADRDKRAAVLPVKKLIDMGFEVICTEGTAAVMARYGIETVAMKKYFELQDGERSILDDIAERKIDLVVNVPSGRQERADGYEIRAAATAAPLPILTTTAEFAAAVSAIEAIRTADFGVASLQDWA